MEARRHGIRLLLSLVNNLQHYGGKTQYVKWAWDEGIGLSSSNDSFFFDPAIRKYFKIYLKVINFPRLVHKSSKFVYQQRPGVCIFFSFNTWIFLTWSNLYHLFANIGAVIQFYLVSY